MTNKWPMRPLKELCTIRPPKKEAVQRLKPEEKISFVPMDCLGILSKNLTLQEGRKLEDVRSSYTYFADNDVLLAKITPCFENGKLGIAQNLTNGVGFGSSEFVVLRSKGEIDPEFLFYFLSQDNFRNAGARVMSGAVGHKRVPKDYIEDHEMPVPLLEEQKRIVALLDEAFAAIARAEANAEKNLANARELFESYVNAIFTRKSEGWGEEKLGYVCEIQSGSGFPKKYQGFKGDKYPFYKVGDMTLVGNETHMNIANNYVSEEVRKALGAKVSPKGSVIFPKVGGAIITNKKRKINEQGCFDNNVMGLIPNENLIDPNFLYWLMWSTDLYELSNKANPPSITQGTVKNWPIKLPPLEDQKRIVALLDRFHTETLRLEDIYKLKFKNLAELKQSLLEKVFNGELTMEKADFEKVAAE